MLNIEMEFRKGILFIRLSGELTKKTVLKLKAEVTNIIKVSGINNVVYNMNYLTLIDTSGIIALYNNYELSKHNHGQSLLCGINNNIVKENIINSRLVYYMKEIKDELSAFKIINI